MAVQENGYVSRGNLIAVTTVAGTVLAGAGGFFTFSYSTQQLQISDLKHTIEGVEGSYLRKEEHAEFLRRIEGRIELIAAQVLRDEHDIVPRSEHDQQWSAEKDRQTRMQADIKEIQAQLGGNFTLHDKLIEIQNHLDALSARLNKDKTNAN